MASAGAPARSVNSTSRNTPFHSRLRPSSAVDMLWTSMPPRLMGIDSPLRLRSCGVATARSMRSRSVASVVALRRGRPEGPEASLQDTAAARKTTLSLRTEMERVAQVLELAIVVEGGGPPVLELQRLEKR